jgi:hypothetical protein
MSKKIYKTAQGKIVDLGALQVQNETVRAVGNMNVNARGDRLDADGNIIATRAQQVNRALNRQTNTAAGPIASSSRAQKETETAADQTAAKEKLEQARAQRQARREAGAAVPETTLPAAGLAAAMARAAQQKDQE